MDDNWGNSPNIVAEGTRPSCPKVSFNAFTAHARAVSLFIFGFVFVIIWKVLLKGW